MNDVTGGRHGLDIQALMRALPVSGLTPQWLVHIDMANAAPHLGSAKTITLLEPPAGRRVPYIEPVDALRKLLSLQGVALERATVQAVATVARMKADLDDDQWVNFFDELEPKSPDCLPLYSFVAWLRHEGSREGQEDFSHLAEDAASVVVSSDILDFFENAAEAAIRTPMFRGPDHWDIDLSLEELPALPPPKAMIEFVPGPPWDDFGVDWECQDNPFLRWREAMRPVALKLEEALGEPVYRFKTLGDELDDDDVHRFLVLHWCCTHKPESPYVRYLMKVSGSQDVDELKEALIDPASYTHPFEMNNTLFALETCSCRINYLPPTCTRW